MQDDQEGESLTCDSCGCEVDPVEADELAGELYCIACMDEATS